MVSTLSNWRGKHIHIFNSVLNTPWLYSQRRCSRFFHATYSSKASSIALCDGVRFVDRGDRGRRKNGKKQCDQIGIS